MAKRRIETWFALFVLSLPGLSVAVGAGGEIVWAEGFGWADLENRVPVAPQTRFRIGTASKALTQGQKQVPVLQDIRADEASLPDDLIVQGAGETDRARQRQGAELQRSARCLPGRATTVAVDARAHVAVGTELEGVLRTVVGCQRRVVAPLEFDESPRCAAQAGRGGRLRLMRT
jgi:hypothetical protein